MVDESFVDAQLRALDEVAVAEAATVSVVVVPERGDGPLDALADAAAAQGFAVASASLGKHGLNDLAEVVRELARSLRLGDRAFGGRAGRGDRRAGLVPALDAFVGAHGKRSLSRFDERATDAGLSGELRRLARSYVESTSGEGSGRRLERWLAGKRLGDIDTGPELRLLGPATARSALAALTRLALVLGAKGTLLLLREGEALVDLSPARRDIAYTVLRELVDNADGHGGLVATKVVVAGTPALVERRHALLEHAALATRIAALDAEPAAAPHACLIRLDQAPHPKLGALDPVGANAQRELRALLRLGQGLPPVRATKDLTLGLEAIDARIDALFEHASNDGSVFAVLSGEYGSGKTHHLLHLEARALEAKRPVLRLSVERLDEDLGNPQRHLRRLLEGGIMPHRARPSLFERLDAWLDSNALRARVGSARSAHTNEEGEAARLAARWPPGAELDVDSLREVLSATDLVEKPSAPSYRRDAYARLLLWLELARRIDGCEGPVVILDEAENLYHPGISRAERRTALRSLAFYCGGAIPRACVVLAVTPATLEALREEAGELLDAIEQQVTLLPQEDVAMLRRRLLRSRPLEVKRLSRAELGELADRTRAVHARVRGKVADPEWSRWVAGVVASAETPREVLRRVVERLERLAFAAS